MRPRRRSALGGARQGRRESPICGHIGATEDAASRRPARSDDSELHRVSGSKLLARLLERPLLLLAGAIALQWLTTLVVALRADSVDLGAAALLNVLVLGPVAIVAALCVAASVGGLALGAWTLLVWVVLPWLAPLYTLSKYDTTMRDDVLPLVLGLTGDAGYAEGVAILAALALLTRRTRPATAAAAAAVLLGLAAIWLSRAPDVDGFSLDALQANLAGLREYFFSQRLLQWVPLAGLIAVARRSIPLALALGGWFGGYVAFRLTSATTFDEGEFFRLLLPALPAFVLLTAALPLLVPTLAARLGPLARPASVP